jgi:hypothetical protein
VIGIQVGVPPVEQEGVHAEFRARSPAALQSHHLHRPGQLEVEAGAHQEVERLVVPLEPDREIELPEVESDIGGARRHHREEQVIDLDLGAGLTAALGRDQRRRELAEDVCSAGDLAKERDADLAGREAVVAGAAGVAVVAYPKAGDLERKAVDLAQILRLTPEIDGLIQRVGGLLRHGRLDSEYSAEQQQHRRYRALQLRGSPHEPPPRVEAAGRRRRGKAETQTTPS